MGRPRRAAALGAAGVPWFDTDGHRIYAGGANMYQENGRFYIVGEGNKVCCLECNLGCLECNLQVGGEGEEFDDFGRP